MIVTFRKIAQKSHVRVAFIADAYRRIGSLIGKRLFGHWRCLMNQEDKPKMRGNDALYPTVTRQGRNSV